MSRVLLNQHGLTLLELMIAMALALLIMLTATGLLLSSKAAYISQNQIATVQESGRYAVQLVSRAIRQSAYPPINEADRKSVVSGKSVSVRVDLGGRRIIKKKKRQT